MNRRDLLRHLGLAAATLPLSSVVLSACSSDTGAPLQQATFRFDDALRRRVSVLVDLIIPDTDTPGASAAGVVDFIELMLDEWFSADERRSFLDGLDDLEARSAEGQGADFVEMAESSQTQLLEQLELEALNEPTQMLEPGSFVSRLKLMTLTGYYTSQVGASIELDNTLAFPTYQGCAEFGPDDRAYSSGASAPDAL